jgi:hypothetical protein
MQINLAQNTFPNLKIFATLLQANNKHHFFLGFVDFSLFSCTKLRNICVV